MTLKSPSPRPRDARLKRRAPALGLLAVLLLSLSACATTPAGTYALDSQRGGAPRKRSSSRGVLGPIQSSLLDMDYFQGLMVRAGVPPHALPKDGRRITPDEALQLLSWLLSADVKMRDFGPWRMASYLLWEVVNGERTVSRQELYERMRRFAQLLVLRPDGYLVLATTGEALQYVDKARDGSLTRHPDARVAGVFSPDKGVLGPAAEGAGMAVVDTVTGLVSLVLHMLP